MDHLNLYVAAIFLLSIIGSVLSGCRCTIKHPQVAFCDQDFVIRAMIKGVKENLAENGYKQYHAKSFDPQKFKESGRQAPKKIIISREYKINVLKVYKSGKKMKMKELLSKTKLMTPGSLASCGTFLRRNTMYLLAGDSILKELWVDGCSWVQPFKSLTRQNFHGLMKKYAQNCQCKIQQCTGKECARGKIDSCDFRQEIYSCYQKYGVCNYKRKNKKCKWKKNRDFRKCLKKQSKNSKS